MWIIYMFLELCKKKPVTLLLLFYAGTVCQCAENTGTHTSVTFRPGSYVGHLLLCQVCCYSIWNFLLLIPFAFSQSSLRYAPFSPLRAGLSPFWGPKALTLCTIWSFGTRSGKKPLSITVLHSCLLFGVQLCKLFLICSARKVSGVFKSRNKLTWIYTVWYRS